MRWLALTILVWIASPAATIAQTPAAGSWLDKANSFSSREFNDRGRDGVEAYIFTVLEYASTDQADMAFEPIAVEFAQLIDDNERVTSAPNYGTRSIAFTGPLIARSGNMAALVVQIGDHLYVLIAGGVGVDPLPDLLALATPIFNERPRGTESELLDELPRLSDLPDGFVMTREVERDLAADRQATPAATPAN